MASSVLFGLLLGFVGVLRTSAQTVSLFGNTWTGDVSDPTKVSLGMTHSVKSWVKAILFSSYGTRIESVRSGCQLA